MSLNDIKLKPRLLSELYANSLVESNTSSVPVTPAPPAAAAKSPSARREVNYLGKNEKGILILVAKDDVAYLPDEELNFLTTILSACQLSLADVAIVNWKSASADLESLQKELNIRDVLLFDVAPLEAGLPINFPHFQIQQFNGRIYLSSPALTDVEKEVTIKRQLWPSLKRMFSI